MKEFSSENIKNVSKGFCPDKILADSSSEKEKRLEMERIAKSISKNDPEKIPQIMENIESTRKAVENGQHEILVYPACGADGLRALIAFNAKRAITIDNNQYLIGETERILDNASINYRVEYDAEEGVKNIYFRIGDQEKIVTEYYKDAKELNIKKILPEGKTDVYHEYFSMNSTKRREESYSLVKENGFLCFNEAGFFGEKSGENVPELFYDLVGLRKISVTKRHPGQIESTLGSDEPFQKEGSILKKERDVDVNIVKKVEEIYMSVFFWKDSLNFVRKNGFKMISEDINEDRVLEIIKSDKNKLREAIKNECKELNFLNIPEEITKKLYAELENEMNKYISDLQKEFKEYFNFFEDVRKKLEEGEITNKEALSQLGLSKEQRSLGAGAKFPMAKYLAVKSADTMKEIKIAKKFMETDFKN